jgi:hypothetical protein
LSVFLRRYESQLTDFQIARTVAIALAIRTALAVGTAPIAMIVVNARTALVARGVKGVRIAPIVRIVLSEFFAFSLVLEKVQTLIVVAARTVRIVVD